MNKKIALLGAVAAMVFVGATESWAFHSQSISTITATVTTGGTPSASFTLAMLDVVNPATTRSNVTWGGTLGPIIPTPGVTWKMADTMLQLTWNVTDANGGIQIYTDNMSAQALPVFVDPTPGTTPGDPNYNNADSNPAGLLQYTSGLSSSTSVLPVAWSIKASTMIVNGTLATGIQPADPDNGVATGPANRYQWLYMKDKSTPIIDVNGDGSRILTAFANGDQFVTAIKQTGIHGAQGPTDFFADGDNVSYVYLQANFKTAAAQTLYRTNQLKVEAFIQ